MNQTDSALEKIAHGTLLALGGIIISKLLGYTYRLIAARFGTEEYGILSLGLAVFNILTLIGVLGLNQGALRYVSFYREKANFSRLKEIITSAVASSEDSKTSSMKFTLETSQKRQSKFFSR